MHTTSGVLTLGIGVLAAGLLFLPGGLALRLIGMRGLAMVALAPAVTSAVLAVSAILAQFAGVRWGMVSALVGSAFAVGGAVLLRAFGVLVPTPTHDVDRRVRIPRWTLLTAFAVGVLLTVVPYWVGMGSPDGFLQRWDAVFHLSALRLSTDTGSASSLTLGALSYGSGDPAIYPAGWHALASLLPGSPTAVLNIASSLTSGPTWVLGCAALARQVWPRLRSAAPVAAVVAGVVTASPMSLWIGWGHVPNAAALAMTPAVLAFGLSALVGEVRLTARTPPARWVGVTLALAVAAGGLALIHPNAFLTLVLLLLPALVAAVGGAAAGWWRAGRRARAVAVPVAAGALLALGAVAFALSPIAGSVSGYVGDEGDPVHLALAQLFAGWYELWPHASTAIITIAAPVGAVLAWRRGAPWVAVMLLLAWALYLDAALGGPTGASALWYTSPARLSVVVSMVAVPLAAGAWGVAVERLRHRVTGRAVRAATGALTVLAVVVLTLTSTIYRTERTERVYGVSQHETPLFVTTDELAMFDRLTTELDPDAVVLGSPFSGAASLYGLTGQPVVFPVAGQVWSADQRLVMESLDSLTTDPRVCAALERLGVRYLYQESVPYQRDNTYGPLDTLEVPGARVVDQAGTARVLELPACTSAM